MNRCVLGRCTIVGALWDQMMMVRPEGVRGIVEDLFDVLFLCEDRQALILLLTYRRSHEQ